MAKNRTTSDRDGTDWMLSLHRLDGAHSENTLRGCRTDFRIFDAWCKRIGRTALPATPETVAAFLDSAPTVTSTSTLHRRLASIHEVRCLFNLGKPTEEEGVLIARRRAQRARHRRPRQALGVTADPP